MRADVYWHQCVFPRIVMIESSFKPFALVHRKVELELVAGARGRIRLDGVLNRRTTDPKPDVAFPCRQDTRRAVEDPRKLGESDWALAIESASRVSVMQDFCKRRNCHRVRGGELAHIDFLSWPSWPQRGERSYDTHIGIKPTQRVGVSTFRATRVE